MKCWDLMDAMIFVGFLMLSFNPGFPLFFFTFIRRLFSSSSLSPITVVSSECLRLLIFLPAIWIPSCASASQAFHIMYSAYKSRVATYSLDITPFPIWNQSVVSCLVLIIASWSAYRFLRRQVRWSDVPISFKNFPVCCNLHSQRLWHSQWSRSRCFSDILLLFNDPVDVGNLISGSSAFSSLNFCNLTVHILLKPSLENFEHYFASMWDECNCAVVWTFFGFPFLWDWNGKWPFPVLWPLLSFPNLLAYWVQQFHSIIF